MKETQHYDIIAAVIDDLTTLLVSGQPDAVAIRDFERRLRIEWGGQAVYVKKVSMIVAERRKAIKERYNMSNRRELQEEFGISRGQFYKDLRAAHYGE